MKSSSKPSISVTTIALLMAGRTRQTFVAYKSVWYYQSFILMAAIREQNLIAHDPKELFENRFENPLPR